MPPHFLSFYVSQFKYEYYGIISLWGSKYDLEAARPYLQFAHHVLRYYERFFTNKYELPKLNIVANPAIDRMQMENFGLVTIR